MQMTDSIDDKLLGLLQVDARAAIADLARQLGLSRTTVQSRIDRLERRGVIAGYSVRLSDEYEQGLVKAHVLITALPKLASQVEGELRKITEVRTVHSVSGAFDLIAIVTAHSVQKLDVLIDTIGRLDGVERTTSSIILSTRIDR
ncbi:Lrp/AsnC family transcriptional regulator [Paraburkholderia sp. BR14263]|uniref:Lrp/AsnC family transcriptional regulator n=1 Tax=unclassified Paraburkholderia TaxID=2615204 RepID=UPI0034CDB071